MIHKTFGIDIAPSEFTLVSNTLEEKGIDYGIWNAEEFWFGNAECVQITVSTQEDMDALKIILNNIRQIPQHKKSKK